MPVDKQPRSAAPRRAVVLLAATVAAFSSATGVVLAQTGGTVAPSSPEVSSITCVTRCIKPSVGTVGSKIRIQGESLESTRVVSLPKGDGRRAKDKDPVLKASGAVVSVVQPSAVTGPLRIADTNGQVHDYNDVPFKVGTEEQLRKIQMQYRFPVRGPHTYGDGLGAGRGHEGQDVFAACGTRLIAAHSGKVVDRSGSAPDGAAGNFVAIWDSRTDITHMYLHMVNPPSVPMGAAVTTGQQIGKVGETGRATGCHLHFEVRRGKGWLGTVLNPTKPLKYWDSYS